MQVRDLGLAGVRLLSQAVHRDTRGWFFEVAHASHLTQAGISREWAQCNVSQSVRGTLRGLHLQQPSAQAKLVAPVSGTIFDVAVDVRRESPTFARWVGVELAAGSGQELFIPEGCAHGFVVLSESATVVYLASALYDPGSEITIRWDDPEIGIAWPIPPMAMSPRDRDAPALKDLAHRLPVFRP